MPDTAQWNEQLQHAITTMVTCRKLLQGEDDCRNGQQDLLAEIDSAVRFLAGCMMTTPPKDVENKEISTSPIEAIHSGAVQKCDDESANVLAALRSLYRVYHVYLHGQADHGVGGFLERFQHIMEALGSVQGALKGEENIAIAPSLEDVKTFITDLYYIFLDFLQAISAILEVHNVYIETEELRVVRERTADTGYFISPLYDLAQLSRVYQAHQQLDKRYNTLGQQITAARALLVFLEEALDYTFGKRSEVIEQLRNLDRLLGDLFMLLYDYERAAIAVLRQK